MATTKLILTNEVAKLGGSGDVVEVKAGYARNFLIPRGLATPWTKGAQRQLEQMSVAASKRAMQSREEAQALRDLLQSKPLVVAERSGENGRLFGAVSSARIAEAVKAGFDKEIDRRKVEFVSPIKSLGEYPVTVRLFEDIYANLQVQVIAAKGQG